MQTLTLAVLGRQAAQFGSRSRKVFPEAGGSIGRSEDCEWVLGAPGVSRIHAMVRYLNGIYFIEDRSTNGMLLNGAPLPRGEPSALKDGDRLQIDTFEISVQVQAPGQAAEAPAAPAPAMAPAPLPGDPLDFGLSDLLAPAPAAAAGASLIPDSAAAGGDLDPLSFLDAPYATPVAEPAPPQSAPIPSWNHTAGSADHFRPPVTDVQRQAQVLPENWDLTMGDFSAPVPPVAAAPVAAAPRVMPAAPMPMAAVDRAEATGSHALPAGVDEIFRVVVDGVMDVLRARAEIKNTFRLPVTIIQRSENNPLKFAPNPEEALQKIMAPSGGAFMSSTAAFEDAFDDIRCHQMAMLAGVRAAFESLLVHFNPDRFEQEADGGSKRSAFAGKGKYWERYREHFEGLNKDPDDCFRRLFGDEFARAYEEQLSRLKSARRMRQATHR